METRGRALFNLMRMNKREDPSLEVEPWQVENYRILPTDTLFKRLQQLNITLDENSFLLYADQAPSPEILVETLCIEENFQNIDHAYVLIFELWRRLLPEKQSLSIFCDELDELIDQYDLDQLENEELLQNALADLEKVLDEHADQGEDSKKIFNEIGLFCAHDLENFIYDYASAQIDEGNPLYASELIDGFFPYIEKEQWFSFLHLRLTADTDPEQATIMLLPLLEELEDAPDFELLLEIARYLVTRGAITHFCQTIQQARKSIETEQDFQELLAISCEFCRLLDREEETHAIAEILKQRQGHSLDTPIQADHPAIESYYQLFKHFDRSEV